MGFVAILLLSFTIVGLVSQFSQEKIDSKSQTACQTDGGC